MTCILAQENTLWYNHLRQHATELVQRCREMPLYQNGSPACTKHMHASERNSSAGQLWRCYF